MSNYKELKMPMNILFLGYGKTETRLIDILEKDGHKVKTTKKAVFNFKPYDLVICFGYRHIINQKTLQSALRPPINLHISYLPFNKGSYSNFWSLVEGTPSGVSIHEIDKGIDTGKIILQEKVLIEIEENTFTKSYEFLIDRIEKLFIENYVSLLEKKYIAIKQTGKGTFHKVEDLPNWLTSWDMKINDAIKKYHAKKHEKKNIVKEYKLDSTIEEHTNSSDGF
jgi:folate-dependent phosphoribosylglycinamide formyltransferase PurN